MFNQRNRREPGNQNTFFAGEVRPNANRSKSTSFGTEVFSQIFGEKSAPITDSIGELQRNMHEGEQESSHSKKYRRTGNMVNSLLEVMNKNKNRLGRKVEQLNVNLMDRGKNQESVQELKETIRNMYALLFSLYKLHTVPLEKRHAILEEVRSKLEKNHHFLNVVNRVVIENNTMLQNHNHNRSTLGSMQNLSMNKGANAHTNMNVREAMAIANMNMNLRLNKAEPKTNLNHSLEAIPTSHDEGEQLLEEAKEAIPEVVVPEERVQEIVEEEQGSAPFSQTFNEQVEPLMPKNVTNQVQNRVENTDLPATSSKRVANLSNRLHTALKGMTPINMNMAQQKLDAMDVA